MVMRFVFNVNLIEGTTISFHKNEENQLRKFYSLEKYLLPPPLNFESGYGPGSASLQSARWEKDCSLVSHRITV